MSLDELLPAVAPWFSKMAIQPFTDFWQELDPSQRPVLFVALAGAASVGLLIGRVWGRRSARRHEDRIQNEGEALVARLLGSEFAPPDYHLMNHVTLAMDDGTTQIDHILLSRFGVFVIETKHYSGWLFGGADDRRWTQVWFTSRFRFQNPLLQNKRHVRAVFSVLDFLPPDAVRSVVVFSGSAEFKKGVPAGVLRVSELAGHIRMQTEYLMSPEKLQYCVGRLETARLALSAQTDVEHVESLRRRHGRAPHN
jgi:hypothetical protein